MLKAVQEDVEEALELPLGRRAHKELLRWLLVARIEGFESYVCEYEKQIASPDVLKDVFVPTSERAKKRVGTWANSVCEFSHDYFVVILSDTPALSSALSKVSLPKTWRIPLVVDWYLWVRETVSFQSSLWFPIELSVPVRKIFDNKIRVRMGHVIGCEERAHCIDCGKYFVQKQMDLPRSSFTLPMSPSAPRRC